MKLLHLRWLSNEHWLQIFFLLNLSRYSKMHLRHEFPITILLFNIAPIGMCSFCLFFKLLQKKRKNKSCFGYMQGRLHRCVTYAVVTQGPTLRKAPCLFECSAVTILKFIIILSLKLCFVNEIQRDNGALHEQIHVYPLFPAAPFAYSFPDAAQTQDSRGLSMGIRRDSKQVQDKHFMEATGFRKVLVECACIKKWNKK